MRFYGWLVSFFLSSQCFAGELSVLDHIKGNYKVNEYNGTEAQGLLEIVAEESAVGFRLIPLAGSNPVPAITMVKENAFVDIQKVGELGAILSYEHGATTVKQYLRLGNATLVLKATQIGASVTETMELRANPISNSSR